MNPHRIPTLNLLFRAALLAGAAAGSTACGGGEAEPPERASWPVAAPSPCDPECGRRVTAAVAVQQPAAVQATA